MKRYGSDICCCGDYRSQHFNGFEQCRVCRNSAAPYDGCMKFRFHRRADMFERSHWRLFHAENGPKLAASSTEAPRED